MKFALRFRVIQLTVTEDIQKNAQINENVEAVNLVTLFDGFYVKIIIWPIKKPMIWEGQLIRTDLKEEIAKIVQDCLTKISILWMKSNYKQLQIWNLET